MKFNNRNVFISPKAHIGKNVRIGDDTVIYDNVFIKDNSVICNNCVIGEPLNDYYSEINYENPPTIIEENALIRSHSIIYAGCKFGKEFNSGHRITIREFSIFGDHCRVGTGCDIQGYVTFGNYCWLLAELHICQHSTVGNFVFIYPYVIFTNDAHPPSNINIGPSIGDFTQITVSSVILPGVKIGRHVLVGAGSVVRNDVADYQLVIGNPARCVKDVREIRSKETGLEHYPWPYQFSRRMPWERIGFEQWLEQNPQYK